MALLEAMGSGLPVVATQVEGVNEVLQQNIQGLLVPPDDTEALTEALLKLINNSELRMKLGREARKRIEESYTTDLMCEKYLKAMQEPNKLEAPEENK